MHDKEMVVGKKYRLSFRGSVEGLTPRYQFEKIDKTFIPVSSTLINHRGSFGFTSSVPKVGKPMFFDCLQEDLSRFPSKSSNVTSVTQLCLNMYLVETLNSIYIIQVEEKKSL